MGMNRQLRKKLIKSNLTIPLTEIENVMLSELSKEFDIVRTELVRGMIHNLYDAITKDEVVETIDPYTTEGLESISLQQKGV